MSTRVSVIGTGAMGSAICRVFLRGGHKVTVWNRTKSKAEALVKEGAELAYSVTSAVCSSPTILICVDSDDVTQVLLNTPETVPNLSGRTVIQVSAVTSKEARKSARWTKEKGGDYLKAAIEAFPEQVISSEGALLVSGAESTYKANEDLFKCIAPEVYYLGEEIGAAPALESALGSYMFGSILACLHGAANCDKEGIPMHTLALMIPDLSKVIGAECKRLIETIESEKYENPHASLRTFAIASGLLVRQAKDANVNSEFPRFAQNLLNKGMENGLGEKEVASIVDVLRKGD